MLATIFWAAAQNSDSYSGPYSSSNIQILASRTQILDKWMDGKMDRHALYLGPLPCSPLHFSNKPLEQGTSTADHILPLGCYFISWGHATIPRYVSPPVGLSVGLLVSWLEILKFIWSCLLF